MTRTLSGYGAGTGSTPTRGPETGTPEAGRAPATLLKQPGLPIGPGQGH